jgi:3-oxoacyl-[acyl-carrier protein] reductase
MNLGIAGRTALVCGASQGLGRGCAEALAREGVKVFINSRTQAKLEATAEEIAAATGAEVIPVAADITTEAGRRVVLASIPNPDILVTNAGGPPTGDFRDWTRDHWIKAIDANMLAPIELIKATVDRMIERKFGRIVNITSNAVKAPIDLLGLSNGARCGLTGFVAGLSRRTVKHNVTINNLLPGTMDTERLRSNFAAMAKNAGQPIDAYTASRLAGVPAGRFGSPEEFGQLCAYVCSAQAGFITGQNLLIDGGVYPGTF